MIKLDLTITTEAPLVLRGTRGGSQFSPPLRYVPGTALRGALAVEYLRNGGRPTDDHFRALFLSDEVSYGPLFPCKEGKRARPLPASAVACKRYKGEHAASIGDALLRLELTSVLLESPGDGCRAPLATLAAWEGCPDCRDRYPGRLPNLRDRLEGYYVEEPFALVSTHTRLLTGVGMSRRTGTAAHRLLFSMGAIEEGQSFQGEVRLHGEEDRLQALLRELAPPQGTLRLGGARSRGQGHVRVEGWTAAENEAEPPLERRWRAFNEAVRRLWTASGLAPPQEDYFTLGVESPLILRNAWLRPVRPADVDAQALGLPPGVERRRAMLKEVTVRGWNVACGLPKEEMPAADAGSVFLFCAPVSLRASIQERLGQIEGYGAGERRNEGFGRMIACSPFHCRT